MNTIELLDQVKKKCEFKSLIRLGESGHHRRLGEIDAHEKLDPIISALCDVILKQDEALARIAHDTELYSISSDITDLANITKSQVAAMLAKIVGT